MIMCLPLSLQVYPYRHSNIIFSLPLIVYLISVYYVGRSKTYRHHRHRAVNSIGRSVGGAKRVGVVSVLSPVPGLKRTGTQTPRHQLPSHQSVISAK